jgi:hypothetical protein
MQRLTKALSLLPPKMSRIEARAQLLKTTLQEARGKYRRQLGDGPARGLWQFELGTEKSRGGVWGVYLHPDTRAHLVSLCMQLGVACDPLNIYNDVLAAGVARLNYWWNAAPMPAVNDSHASWLYYKNTWHPGKPIEETWPEFNTAVVHYLVAQ